jgi:hypothetical protein
VPVQRGPGDAGGQLVDQQLDGRPVAGGIRCLAQASGRYAAPAIEIESAFGARLWLGLFTHERSHFRSKGGFYPT